MSKTNANTDSLRRQFLKRAGCTAVAAPVAFFAAGRALVADDAKLVDENSAQAVALQYVGVSRTDGKTCGNCALYQSPEGADSAPCALFPGQLVAKDAWCVAWAARG